MTQTTLPGGDVAAHVGAEHGGAVLALGLACLAEGGPLVEVYPDRAGRAAWGHVSSGGGVYLGVYRLACSYGEMLDCSYSASGNEQRAAAFGEVMPKFRVHMSAVSSYSVTVEADDYEEAIDTAYRERTPTVCAQDSGWRQDWSLDLGETWEVDAVEDADGKEVWTDREVWFRRAAKD